MERETVAEAIVRLHREIRERQIQLANLTNEGSTEPAPPSPPLYHYGVRGEDE